MRKFLYLTYVLVLALTGCEKDKILTTTVSGTVIDYGDGTPVVGITVRMKDGIKLSDPLFGETGDFSGGINETLTDDEGNFALSIEGKNSAAVAPVAQNANDYWNYDQGETAVSNSFNGYKNGTLTEGEIFRMKSKAYCGMKFQNSQNVKDSIRFDNLNADLSPDLSHINIQPTFRSNLILRDRTTIGNMYFRYKFEFKRDGKWNNIIDSVYVAKGDTIKDVVYY